MNSDSTFYDAGCQVATHRTHTTLKFQDIDFDALDAIRNCLQHTPTRTCDYTIGGIFMWIRCFAYQYCIEQDTLFLKGNSESHPGETAFSLPVGRLPLQQAVELLRDYCASYGMALNFTAIPEEFAADLAALTGGAVEALDGWSDYIYDIQALASLSGKHLSKKRNHVNRFMADNPDYQIEDITADVLPELELFFAGRHEADKLNAFNAEMAEYEHAECGRVLENYCRYPFEGLILRGQTGEIVAFTMGEVIGDTLYSHIEKANHEVAGSGESINKFFAQTMLQRHPQLRYVNREEDMNDPGLRYAKQSYHPAMLLNKYNVRG